jgi:hypothetical protein
VLRSLGSPTRPSCYTLLDKFTSSFYPPPLRGRKQVGGAYSLFAPTLALWTRLQYSESYGRRSTGSPTRPSCYTTLIILRVSTLSKKTAKRGGRDSAPSPPETARVGQPLRLLLLIAISDFTPFESLSKKTAKRGGRDSNPRLPDRQSGILGR